MITGLQEAFTQANFLQKWEVEATVDAAVDKYLDLYIDFAILEERIEGNLPAFEGIRIVRERMGEDIGTQ